MQAGNLLISKRERRRAFRLAYANGALWSLGNGLASTLLIVYMVRQLGAAGLGIGVILAAPHLVGALRLVAPVLVGRAGSRKILCLAAYGASAIVLAAISQLAEPRQLASPALSLYAIVALWCVYHLLEYVGTVYLWAWLGDIAPRRIRGRFIGSRERWMLIARIVGMLAGGAFSAAWLDTARLGVAPWFEAHRAHAWLGYALPAAVGAAFMMTALVPLVRMPEPAAKASRPGRRLPLSAWWQPLADRNMRWLLAFGAWFSLANGLTQSAQYLFPIAVFGLTLLMRNVLETSMRLGQAAIARRVGAFIDQYGNRPVLIVAQLSVALGPLLLFVASLHGPPPLSRKPLMWFIEDPVRWSIHQAESLIVWLAGGGVWLCMAWLAWIAYVGLNVGLPNLMLKLAGPTERASYIAWYFALTGVVYGICTIAGGALYSLLEREQPKLDLGLLTFDYNELLFLAGFFLRATAVLCLLPIVESAWGRSPDLPVLKDEHCSGRSGDLPH